MRRVMCVVAITLLVLAWAVPVSAQTKWSGFYAGVDVGGGFRDLNFSVADSSQAPCCRLINGHAGHGLNVGGHAGMDRQIWKKIVVGGEFGFGRLSYHGEISTGLGSDTMGETDGGLSWTAMGRAGYVFERAMPYFAFGVLGSKNTAHIVDACNTHPCGDSLGEGSNTTPATRWIYAVGSEFAATKRIAGRDCAVRVEWVQVESSPVLNSFAWTLTGPGLGTGRDFPVDVTTNLPRGMFRVLFDLRLTK